MEALGVMLNPAGLSILGISLLLNVVFITALARGWLLPGNWVDKLLKNKDSQIEKLESANGKLLAGMDPLAKLLETMNDELGSKEE